MEMMYLGGDHQDLDTNVRLLHCEQIAGNLLKLSFNIKMTSYQISHKDLANPNNILLNQHLVSTIIIIINCLATGMCDHAPPHYANHQHVSVNVLADFHVMTKDCQ